MYIHVEILTGTTVLHPVQTSFPNPVKQQPIDVYLCETQSNSRINRKIITNREAR